MGKKLKYITLFILILILILSIGSQMIVKKDIIVKETLNASEQFDPGGKENLNDLAVFYAEDAKNDINISEAVRIVVVHFNKEKKRIKVVVMNESTAANCNSMDACLDTISEITGFDVKNYLLVDQKTIKTLYDNGFEFERTVNEADVPYYDDAIKQLAKELGIEDYRILEGSGMLKLDSLQTAAFAGLEEDSSSSGKAYRFWFTVWRAMRNMVGCSLHDINGFFQSFGECKSNITKDQKMALVIAFNKYRCNAYDYGYIDTGSGKVVYAK